MLSKPSPQHRTDGRCDRGEAGPRPARAAAFLLGKTGADQSQAARDQQSPADSLKTSRDNQLLDVGRKSAPSRGGREERYPDEKNSAPAVQVTQRAADEE